MSWEVKIKCKSQELYIILINVKIQKVTKCLLLPNEIAFDKKAAFENDPLCCLYNTLLLTAISTNILVAAFTEHNLT